MQDKHKKHIRTGTWLLCVCDTERCGETVRVESEGGALCLPDCNGISCSLPLSAFASDDGVIEDFVVIDDPTRPLSYARAAERYQKLDLTCIERNRFVDPNDLSLEQIARLRALGYDDLYPYEDKVLVAEPDVIYADCDDETDNPAEYVWGNDAEERLSMFLKPANHYLVYARGVNWTGEDGFRFTSSRASAVYRNYEASIYPRSASSNGKVLLCREYSHDVPTGSQTFFVALTDSEYDRLSERDCRAAKRFVGDLIKRLH